MRFPYQISQGSRVSVETVLLLAEDKERGKVCLEVAREKGTYECGGESRDSAVW